MFTTDGIRAINAQMKTPGARGVIGNLIGPDHLNLSNQALADAFQISRDRLDRYMSGDDTAITASEAAYMLSELNHLAEAQDVDRAEAKSRGVTSAPGWRDVLGIK